MAQAFVQFPQNRENIQYRSNIADSNPDSRGFLSGLVSLSRKVSGFFASPSASTSKTVATFGIRGRGASTPSIQEKPSRRWLNPQQIVDSAGDKSQLRLLQTYASSVEAGREFAFESGLKTRSLPLLSGR